MPTPIYVNTITDWTVDYADNMGFIADGINIIPDEILLDQNSIDWVDLGIIHDTTITEDFEIVFNLNIPAFDSVAYNADQQFYIGLDLEGNSGASWLGLILVSYPGTGSYLSLSGSIGRLFNLWNDGYLDIILPYLLTFKIKRIGDQLTFEFNGEIVYTETNTSGFSVVDIFAEWWASCNEIPVVWNGPVIGGGISKIYTKQISALLDTRSLRLIRL